MNGYGVTQDTPDPSGGSKTIPPGINEDVTFVKAELIYLKEDDTSKPKVLAITFSKEGGELREVIFPIDEASERANAENNPRQSKIAREVIGLRAGDIISADQAIYLAYENFNARLKHLQKAFIKDENAIIDKNLTGYEDMATRVINRLKPFFGKKVRLKVVLDKKDYSGLPKYGYFIEYEVELGESKLKILANDKVKRADSEGDAKSEDYSASAPPAPKSSTTAPPAPPAPGAPPAPKTAGAPTV